MTDAELALVIDLRAALAATDDQIARLEARWADDYGARHRLATWQGRKEALEWALVRLVLVERQP